MRKSLLQIATYLFLFLTVQIAIAQSQPNQEIKNLQDRLQKVEDTNSKLSKVLIKQQTVFSQQLDAANDSIDTLKSKLQSVEQIIHSNKTELVNQITTTQTNASADKQQLNNKIKDNTLYWIIAVLAIALLSVLLFGLLRKQVTKNKTDITANIQQTKKALEEEGVKLDSKLVDLLATQMQLMKEERQAVPSSKAEEVNHELALKVADEIIRIQKNLGNMDAETKGLKQLVASVKRIQDNFEANGYELIDMLNKPYDQGMKVSANFRPDETLKAGEQIITRIIKPQVNFKGVMIQAAQVEVSVGE
jgi:hypothetical protein